MQEFRRSYLLEKDFKPLHYQIVKKEKLSHRKRGGKPPEGSGAGKVWRHLQGLAVSKAKRRQLYESVEVAATCEDTAA